MHRAVRVLVVAAVTGFTAVSVGWAAAGIAPVDLSSDLDTHGVTGGLADPTGGTLPGVETQHLDELVARASDAGPALAAGRPAHARGRTVPAGQVLVGTSVVDITPDPPTGETWQTDGCATGIPNEALLQTRKTTTPDCIYMGGRGLGPSEPITRVDPANPLEVRTASIGDAAGPGELFSNLTNTLKDQHPQATVLPLANVNDGLGCIMQSFEEDALGRQVLGFTDAPVEYEEAFSLDSCFGDAVLESSLGLLRSLTSEE